MFKQSLNNAILTKSNHFYNSKNIKNNSTFFRAHVKNSKQSAVQINF